MAAQSHRRTGGRLLLACYVEAEVISRHMARSFERRGWLRRSVIVGKPTIINLTPLGLWILEGAEQARRSA